jgi:hypothetical protein
MGSIQVVEHSLVVDRSQEVADKALRGSAGLGPGIHRPLEAVSIQREGNQLEEHPS